MVLSQLITIPALTVGRVLLAALIGAFSGKYFKYAEFSTAGISAITIKVFLPAMLCSRLASDMSWDALRGGYGWAIVLSLVPLAMGHGLGLYLKRYIADYELHGLFVLAATFQNAVSYGLGVTQLLRGPSWMSGHEATKAAEEFAMTVFLWNLLHNLLIWSVGSRIVRHAKEDEIVLQYQRDVFAYEERRAMYTVALWCDEQVGRESIPRIESVACSELTLMSPQAAPMTMTGRAPYGTSANQQQQQRNATHQLQQQRPSAWRNYSRRKQREDESPRAASSVAAESEMLDASVLCTDAVPPPPHRPAASAVGAEEVAASPPSPSSVASPPRTMPAHSLQLPPTPTPVSAESPLSPPPPPHLASRDKRDVVMTPTGGNSSKDEEGDGSQMSGGMVPITAVGSSPTPTATTASTTTRTTTNSTAAATAATSPSDLGVLSTLVGTSTPLGGVGSTAIITPAASSSIPAALASTNNTHASTVVTTQPNDSDNASARLATAAVSNDGTFAVGSFAGRRRQPRGMLGGSSFGGASSVGRSSSLRSAGPDRLLALSSRRGQLHLQNLQQQQRSSASSAALMTMLMLNASPTQSSMANELMLARSRRSASRLLFASGDMANSNFGSNNNFQLAMTFSDGSHICASEGGRLGRSARSSRYHDDNDDYDMSGGSSSDDDGYNPVPRTLRRRHGRASHHRSLHISPIQHMGFIATPPMPPSLSMSLGVLCEACAAELGYSDDGGGDVHMSNSRGGGGHHDNSDDSSDDSDGAASSYRHHIRRLRRTASIGPSQVHPCPRCSGQHRLGLPDGLGGSFILGRSGIHTPINGGSSMVMIPPEVAAAAAGAAGGGCPSMEQLASAFVRFAAVEPTPPPLPVLPERAEGWDVYWEFLTDNLTNITIMASFVGIGIGLITPLRYVAEQTILGPIVLGALSYIGDANVPMTLLQLGTNLTSTTGGRSVWARRAVPRPAAVVRDPMESVAGDVVGSQQPPAAVPPTAAGADAFAAPSAAAVGTSRIGVLKARVKDFVDGMEVPPRFIGLIVLIRLFLIPAAFLLLILFLRSAGDIPILGPLPTSKPFLLTLLIESCAPTAINTINLCSMYQYKTAAFSQALLGIYVCSIFTTAMWLSLYLWLLW